MLAKLSFDHDDDNLVRGQVNKSTVLSVILRHEFNRIKTPSSRCISTSFARKEK